MPPFLRAPRSPIPNTFLAHYRESFLQEYGPKLKLLEVHGLSDKSMVAEFRRGT